ncbi:YhcN/YlaJ family sporulation lipoprotein [Paenibacillus sp. FSL R5-0407]|uniref:YhcN/YlaJ family sporulation lipoprotein n=1 Tax=Paenibacillus sp. FSL R5-0407 TaxID=2975320 RepID=UPI0030F4DF42
MRIWLCLLLTIFLLTSCGTATKKASPSPQNQTNNGPRAQSTNDGNRNMTDGTGTRALSATERQNHLEELVKRVPGVKGAHCVVMGKTAVVGIDVDSKLERARVGNIKYTVAEALRKDPQGAGAIVTADIDLNQRIAEIGDKIANGNPIGGFATELADIIGRIVPQMPGDTTPRDNVPKVQNNGTGNVNDGIRSNGTIHDRTGGKQDVNRTKNHGTKEMQMAPGR